REIEKWCRVHPGTPSLCTVYVQSPLRGRVPYEAFRRRGLAFPVLKAAVSFSWAAARSSVETTLYLVSMLLVFQLPAFNTTSSGMSCRIMVRAPDVLRSWKRRSGCPIALAAFCQALSNRTTFLPSRWKTYGPFLRPSRRPRSSCSRPVMGRAVDGRGILVGCPGFLMCVSFLRVDGQLSPPVDVPDLHQPMPAHHPRR